MNAELSGGGGVTIWEKSPMPKSKTTKHISFSPAPPVVFVAKQQSLSCVTISGESFEDGDFSSSNTPKGSGGGGMVPPSPVSSRIQIALAKGTGGQQQQQQQALASLSCELEDPERSQSACSSVCESGSCSFQAVTPVGAAAEEQLRQYREAVSSVKESGAGKSLREVLACGVLELPDDCEHGAAAAAAATSS